jgi:hypothetical protein
MQERFNKGAVLPALRLEDYSIVICQVTNNEETSGALLEQRVQMIEEESNER